VLSKKGNLLIRVALIKTEKLPETLMIVAEEHLYAFMRARAFKKEGTVRKSFFMRGEWRDAYLYSILREEWKEPKILTKTTSQN